MHFHSNRIVLIFLLGISPYIKQCKHVELISTSAHISSSDRSRLGMLQLELAGSLGLGLSTALRLRPLPLRARGPQVHPLPLFLEPFPSLGLSSLALPSLAAATTGRAAAPFITSSPSHLPATSILQVCPPLLFPSAVQDRAPQTLKNYLYSDLNPVTIYYLLTSISCAKIIGCTCVLLPCP